MPFTPPSPFRRGGERAVGSFFRADSLAGNSTNLFYGGVKCIQWIHLRSGIISSGHA